MSLGTFHPGVCLCRCVTSLCPGDVSRDTACPAPGSEGAGPTQTEAEWDRQMVTVPSSHALQGLRLAFQHGTDAQEPAHLS